MKSVSFFNTFLLPALALLSFGLQSFAPVEKGAEPAQRFYFKSIEVEDGLSQNMVYAIVQDSQGFIWIGTQNGLNRYDGTGFKIFKRSGLTNSGLSSDAIFSLSTDRHNRIWVGTHDGLNIYDPETEAFSQLLFIGDDGVEIHGLIRDMATGPDGSCWVTIADSCLFHIQTDLTIKQVSLKTAMSPHGKIRSLCTDGDGNLWIATFYSGLLRIDSRTGSLDSFLLGRDGSLSENNFTSLLLQDNNTLLVGTVKNGLLSFDLRTHTFIPVPGMDGEVVHFVHDICLDGDNRIWVGAENGLHVRSESGVTHLIHNHNDPYSISDNAVYSITRDRDGGMWVGTYFGGINYYSRYSSQFEKYFPLNCSFSLSGKNISEFCENGDGRLWVATEDAGLNLFDPSRQHFESGFIPANNIHALTMLDGRLWVGTYSEGLFVLDPRTSRWRQYTASTSEGSLHNNSIYSIYQDYQGVVWIGTEMGLYTFDPEQDAFMQVNKNQIFSQANDILQHFDGKIWIATIGQGLFSYDKEHDRWDKYLMDDTTQGLLVTCLMEDRDHNLWVGTSGSGIFRLDHQSDTFSLHITETDGLPNDVIYKLLEDETGNIWGSTDKGLFSLSSDHRTIRSFNHRVGLLGDQYNYKSGIYTTDHKMYFGGVKGFVGFVPSALEWHNSSSTLVFNKFQLFNEDVVIGSRKSPLSKTISMTDHVELKPSQSVFTIGYTDLGFASADANTYQYRLAGLDKDWINSPRSYSVTYSDLRPGRYRFEVRVISPDSSQAEERKFIDIRILPPYYRTIWAYLLYGVLLSGALVFIIKSSAKRMREKDLAVMSEMERKKEKELYNSKIEFFTNITHEIRTPLTLIAVPLEGIIKHKDAQDPDYEDLLTIHRNTDRLLNLVNELLDFKKIGSKELMMNFVHSDLVSIIQETVNDFKPVSDDNHLAIQTSFPSDRYYADIDKEVFSKILSNLLSNACKHAASSISIALADCGPVFRVVISNDGDTIPISQAEKIFDPFVKLDAKSRGSGIGLPFARILAEAHNGRLFLDTLSNQATFIVELPAKQELSISLQDIDSSPSERASEKENKSYIEGELHDKRTLLLVEDNEEFLSYLKRQLSEQYQVLCATDGKEALKVLASESIDLIISDLMMPRMDGLELCASIKDNLEYCHIPVIILTAKSDLRTRIESMKIGADEYITKPFSSEYLKARIDNLLAGREHLRMLYQHSPDASVGSIAHTRTDKVFMEKLLESIKSKMENPDLGVDDLAQSMNMSRATLYRKMKGITELTPNDFIRLCRLKRAAQLLLEKEFRVNEVAYVVGFNSSSYFSKCFYKQFGVLPKDYVKD